MDEFYTELYGDFIFGWVKSLCVQYHLPDFKFNQTKTYKKATISKRGLVGSITFWIKDGIIEEEIVDHTGYSIFYLHYNIVSLKQGYYFVKDFVNAFINFLNLMDTHVLLCCSGGLSTTLFSDNFQAIADQYHFPITFEAKGIHQVKSVINQYGLILLAPQIAYMQAEVIGWTDHQQEVICLSASDFGKQNYYQLFFEIVDGHLSKKTL